MAKTIKFSVGRFILQIALGLFFLVGGIWALTGGGDAASLAIKEIFSGNIRTILVIVFGIIEILCGIFLILELFLTTSLKNLRKILLLIIAIVWIVAIVLIDFFGGHGLFHTNAFLSWLYQFADHLIILGGIIVINVF